MIFSSIMALPLSYYVNSSNTQTIINSPSSNDEARNIKYGSFVENLSLYISQNKIKISLQAVDVSTIKDKMFLKGVAGSLLLNNGQNIHFTTKKGLIYLKEKRMHLTSGVTLLTSNFTSAFTDTIVIDYRQDSLESAKPITIKNNKMMVTAQNFSTSESGDKFYFNQVSIKLKSI